MILKFTTSLLMVLFLVGCTKTETTTTTGSYSLPDELKDCRVYKLESSSELDLNVVRCPNSTTETTTAYRSGKTTHYENVTVIDGKLYQEIKPTEDTK